MRHCLRVQALRIPALHPVCSLAVSLGTGICASTEVQQGCRLGSWSPVWGPQFWTASAQAGCLQPVHLPRHQLDRLQPVRAGTHTGVNANVNTRPMPGPGQHTPLSGQSPTELRPECSALLCLCVLAHVWLPTTLAQQRC